MTTEINPAQRWEIALNADGHWRPVQVINVSGDQVEVLYLDMGTAPELMRAFTLSRRQMLENKKRFRLVQTAI